MRTRAVIDLMGQAETRPFEVEIAASVGVDLGFVVETGVEKRLFFERGDRSRQSFGRDRALNPDRFGLFIATGFNEVEFNDSPAEEDDTPGMQFAVRRIFIEVLLAEAQSVRPSDFGVLVQEPPGHPDGLGRGFLDLGAGEIPRRGAGVRVGKVAGEVPENVASGVPAANLPRRLQAFAAHGFYDLGPLLGIEARLEVRQAQCLAPVFLILFVPVKPRDEFGTVCPVRKAFQVTIRGDGHPFLEVGFPAPAAHQVAKRCGRQGLGHLGRRQHVTRCLGKGLETGDGRFSEQVPDRLLASLPRLFDEEGPVRILPGVRDESRGVACHVGAVRETTGHVIELSPGEFFVSSLVASDGLDKVGFIGQFVVGIGLPQRAGIGKQVRVGQQKRLRDTSHRRGSVQRKPREPRVHVGLEGGVSQLLRGEVEIVRCCICRLERASAQAVLAGDLLVRSGDDGLRLAVPGDFEFRPLGVDACQSRLVRSFRLARVRQELALPGRVEIFLGGLHLVADLGCLLGLGMHIEEMLPESQCLAFRSREGVRFEHSDCPLDGTQRDLVGGDRHPAEDGGSERLGHGVEGVGKERVAVIEDVAVGTGKRVAIHRFREPAFQEGVQRPVGEKFLRSLAVLDGIIQRRVGEVLAEGSESGVAEGEVVEVLADIGGVRGQRGLGKSGRGQIRSTRNRGGGRGHGLQGGVEGRQHTGGLCLARRHHEGQQSTAQPGADPPTTLSSIS